MICLLKGLAIGLLFGMPVELRELRACREPCLQGQQMVLSPAWGHPWQRVCMVLSEFLAPACFLRLSSVNKSQLYLICGSHTGCGNRGPQTLRLS